MCYISGRSENTYEREISKCFTEILDNMPNLSYKTTWSEAQQMLLDNPTFTEDPDLQSKLTGFLLTYILR